jgi:hypothetical protein
MTATVLKFPTTMAEVQEHAQRIVDEHAQRTQVAVLYGLRQKHATLMLAIEGLCEQAERLQAEIEQQELFL